MSAIRILLSFSSLCTFGIPMIRGCSVTGPNRFPDPLGLPVIVAGAPYVVHATAVDKDSTETLAIMEVHCVFKPDMAGADTPFPGTIYVYNFVHPSSCLENPAYQVGVDYVMALVNYTGTDIPSGFEQEPIFDSYVPSVMQTNIYLGTPTVLQDTLRVCGVAPSRVGNSTCPESSGLRPNDCGETTTPELPDMTGPSRVSDMTSPSRVSDMTTSLTASLTVVGVVSCVVLAMMEG